MSMIEQAEACQASSSKAAVSQGAKKRLKFRCWRAIKDEVYQYYMVDGHTLSDTILTMQSKHKFEASRRTWKSRLEAWGFEKNVPAEDLAIVLAKAEKRKRDEGKETDIAYYGTCISQEKIRRFQRRKLDDSLVASPSAQTPVGIVYHTPPSDLPEFDEETPTRNSSPMREEISTDSVENELQGLSLYPITLPVIGEHVKLFLTIDNITAFSRHKGVPQYRTSIEAREVYCLLPKLCPPRKSLLENWTLIEMDWFSELLLSDITMLKIVAVTTQMSIRESADNEFKDLISCLMSYFSDKYARWVVSTALENTATSYQKGRCVDESMFALGLCLLLFRTLGPSLQSTETEPEPDLSQSPWAGVDEELAKMGSNALESLSCDEILEFLLGNALESLSCDEILEFLLEVDVTDAWDSLTRQRPLTGFGTVHCITLDLELLLIHRYLQIVRQINVFNPVKRILNAQTNLAHFTISSLIRVSCVISDKNESSNLLKTKLASLLNLSMDNGTHLHGPEFFRCLLEVSVMYIRMGKFEPAEIICEHLLVNIQSLERVWKQEKFDTPRLHLERFFEFSGQAKAKQCIDELEWTLQLLKIHDYDNGNLGALTTTMLDNITALIGNDKLHPEYIEPSDVGPSYGAFIKRMCHEQELVTVGRDSEAIAVETHPSGPMLSARGPPEQKTADIFPISRSRKSKASWGTQSIRSSHGSSIKYGVTYTSSNCTGIDLSEFMMDRI